MKIISGNPSNGRWVLEHTLTCTCSDALVEKLNKERNSSVHEGEDAGLINIEEIHMGIDKKDDTHAGVFYMFLDQDKKKAYAIAGKTED